MHYFIDGYNLLFRTGRLGEDLQDDRDQIIQELAEEAEQLGLDITLVFDSTFQKGMSTRSHFNKIEIVFTSFGEEADDYILNELESIALPQQETVVTSDKRLAWKARRRKALTETIEEFLAWVKKRQKSKKRLKKTEKVKPKSKIPEVAHTIPTSEGTQEFYLKTFENKFEEEERHREQKKEKKLDKLITKKKKKVKTKALAKETDMQRWLKAFERQDTED
jgi:predicted RNA-binding protein with PIN domain